MGEFRDRMERDLQIRGFGLSTQYCYLARMKAMVQFFMRPPDELTLDDIHAYQLHLTRDRTVGWGAFNQSVSAIRFFYGVTLNRDWDIQRIPYQKTGRKLPVVLSGEEVSKLFQIVTNLEHRAILMTAYAGGLRVSEVTHLRVSSTNGRARRWGTKHQQRDSMPVLHRPVEAATIIGHWLDAVVGVPAQKTAYPS